MTIIPVRTTVEATDTHWKVVFDADDLPEGERLEVLVGFAQRDEWMRGWDLGEDLWEDGYLLRQPAEGRGSWSHEYRIDPRYRPIVIDTFHRNVAPFEGSRPHRLILEHIRGRESRKSLLNLSSDTALLSNAIRTLRAHNVLRKTPNGQLTVTDERVAHIVKETGRLEGELHGDPTEFQPADYTGDDLADKDFVESAGGCYQITEPSVREAYETLSEQTARTL